MSRNSEGIRQPICIAKYADGTEVRMSFWSADGQPPFDVNRGKRLCDCVYAGILYRRANPEEHAGTTLAELEFHDEAAFRRKFRPKGAAYEVYHPEIGRRALRPKQRA